MSGNPSREETYTGRGSMMLLRVMGLESIVQKYGLELVISDLNTIEEFIHNEVKSQQGLLNGNLKNGVYVFFGWGSNTTTEPLRHAEEAFACAKAIQLKSAKALQDDERIKHPLFPLQIAISTDIFSVCRRNQIREENKVINHSGIIGKGVDLARRIVDYCGIKSVVISPETERVLEHLNVNVGLKNEIHIKLPNSSRRITAFEHNVLQLDQDFYNVVTNRIKHAINRRMDEQRWRCPDGNISVTIQNDQYRLMNISRGGLEMEGDFPHTHGEIVFINFDNTDGTLRVCTEKLNLNDIRCEVRWNRKSHHKYNLGLMLLDLTEPEREELISLLISNTKAKTVI